MENDDEMFFYEDEVAMKSPKSGLVKYGLVLTTNRARSEIELKKSTYKQPNEIKVIWHPAGVEEVIPDDKVSTVAIVYILLKLINMIVLIFTGCAYGSIIDAW